MSWQSSRGKEGWWTRLDAHCCVAFQLSPDKE